MSNAETLNRATSVESENSTSKNLESGSLGIPPNSIPMAISLGVIASFLAIELHELGHALFAFFFGAKNFFLAVYMDVAPEPSGIGELFTNIGGTIINIVLGPIAYVCFLLTPRGSHALRAYFFWLLAALNLLMGAAYIWWSAITGIGDWAYVIPRGPHHSINTLLMGAAGIIASYIFSKILAKGLALFAGNLHILTIWPYLASIVIGCVSSLISPGGWRITVIGALPATTLGFGGMTYLAFMANNIRTGDPSKGNHFAFPLVKHHLVVIVFGALTAAAYLFVGHGIRFHLP